MAAAPAWATEVSNPSPSAPVPAAVPQLAMLPQLPPPAPPLFAITPERRALLNTIRYAEGTWREGHPLGYRVLFGGSLVDSLDRHPNRVMYTARYASAAAGAYQFMPFTWDRIVRAMGFRDFQPDAQDQGALFLIQRRGALALADQGALSPRLVALLAPEWASLPTLAGGSYYGQPVRRYADLRRFYEQNLAELRQSAPEGWENGAVEPLPPRCQDDSLLCRLDSLGPRPRHAGAGAAVTLSSPN